MDIIDTIREKWDDLDDDTKFNVKLYGGSFLVGVVIGTCYTLGANAIAKPLKWAANVAQETNSDVIFVLTDRKAKTRSYFKAIPVQTSIK